MSTKFAKDMISIIKKLQHGEIDNEKFKTLISQPYRDLLKYLEIKDEQVDEIIAALSIPSAGVGYIPKKEEESSLIDTSSR